jgi:hypothetical protein
MEAPIRPLQNLGTVRTLFPTSLLRQFLELLPFCVLLADPAVLGFSAWDAGACLAFTTEA